MTTQPQTYDQMTNQIEQCLNACRESHRQCLSSFTHCLERGGDHAAPAHIDLLLNCAELCQTTANFMMRSAAAHVSVWSACAEVCLRCAEDCERFDDDLMKNCAAVCRRCAESCQLMVANATAASKM